jgi:hypothetical protein
MIRYGAVKATLLVGSVSPNATPGVNISSG